MMLEQFIESVMAQLNAPKQDIEKNIRALASEWITQMDLVSRTELDRQFQQLDHAKSTILVLKDQIDQLEQRLTELERATTDES